MTLIYPLKYPLWRWPLRGIFSHSAVEQIPCLCRLANEADVAHLRNVDAEAIAYVAAVLYLLPIAEVDDALEMAEQTEV